MGIKLIFPLKAALCTIVFYLDFWKRGGHSLLIGYFFKPLILNNKTIFQIKTANILKMFQNNYYIMIA